MAPPIRNAADRGIEHDGGRYIDAARLTSLVVVSIKAEVKSHPYHVIAMNDREVVDHLRRKYSTLCPRRVVVGFGDRVVIDRGDVRIIRVRLRLCKEEVEL